MARQSWWSRLLFGPDTRALGITYALRWLSHFDEAKAEAREDRRDSFSADSLAEARKANELATQANATARSANIIATIAMISAVLAIAVSIISIFTS